MSPTKNITRNGEVSTLSVNAHCFAGCDSKYRSMRVLVATGPRIASDTNGQSFYDVLDKSEIKSNSIHHAKEEQHAADIAITRNEERTPDGHRQC
jgi:hypothetical protein